MSNEDAGLMVQSEIPRMLTFTGSAKVGWELKARAGKKRVTLELGGNAGVIVHCDADIEDAATRCAIGGFTYSGQSCISVQRVRVERSVFERFKSALVEKVRALKVGDPRDGATDVGPLIRESDAVRVEQWISEAVRQGAKLLCGGKRGGLFISPAVLTETKPSQRVNCEEIFAPVVTVEPYNDFDEALREINSTPYGLQAGIFTNDARLQWRAFEELNVGGVMLNEAPTFRMDHMPYGGVKDSGLGREGVRSAIAEMTEEKIMVVR
jgi:acyl-CoA reductase-like NAD-dependent aldehyde dehydrogenase